MKKEYNGYTNYETWLLCLNIDNDQGLQSNIKEQVNEYPNADNYELGQNIKEYLEEIFYREDCGIYRIDHDSWTFRDWKEINWKEVAETRLQE